MTDVGSVEVVVGDITQVGTDAIVNAANDELQMGGGVCGAIFRAAGASDLTRACDAIGDCEAGEAVATPAFAIPNTRIIVHAVGPIYDAYDPAEAQRLLRSAYEAAIRVACENGCKSIAFPAISTGIYGYPLEEACAVAAQVCTREAGKRGIAIKLVAFNEDTADCLRQYLLSS